MDKNPLLSILGGNQGGAAGQPQNNPMNNPGQMAQLMQNLMSNPVGFLRANRLDVPDSMAGNPQMILNHLVQTGQVNSALPQMAMNAVSKNPALSAMLGMMGIK
jgi:hypothetical protein